MPNKPGRKVPTILRPFGRRDAQKLHLKEKHHMTTNTTNPTDPALAGHLAELKEICREVGAIDMRVLRNADMAWLYYEANGQVGEIRIPKSSTIFLARFSATDGGDPGLE